MMSSNFIKAHKPLIKSKYLIKFVGYFNYLTLNKTAEAREINKLRITLTLTALELIVVSLADNSLIHYLSLLLGVLLIVFMIFK